MAPSLVSAHFAKSPTIFLRPAKLLHRKLDTLIAYGVEHNSILNSPATFRMSQSNLEKRLAELKCASVEPIFSWRLTAAAVQIDE